jgi:HK97 family phage portal protein
MPRWSVVFSMVANLELTGRGLLMLEDDRDGLKLWSIPTRWATPEHDYKRPFAGWSLKPPNRVDQEFVPGSEMIHVVYPDPSDPLGAVAPLEACGLSVLADERLQTAQYAAFENGINPNIALIVGDVQRPGLPDARPALQKHQRQQIISSVRQHYAGAWRNREPLILDALIRDIKKISLTPDEMDFLQSGQITKARILQTFGVSPAVLGELVDANRASSAAAEAHFATSTLAPKIELLNRGLSEWLAPRFAAKGETLRIRIAPPEVSDPEVVRTNVQTLLQAGALTRNEARSILMGLGPMANGDTVVMSFSSVLQEG